MPAIINSRNGITMYGFREALAPSESLFTLDDFYLFLDAIGITSAHRHLSSNLLGLRFPLVDTDILSYLPSTAKGQRLIISIQPHYPILLSFNSHNQQTLELVSNSLGNVSVVSQNPGAGYLYACGDSKGIATFCKAATGSGYLFQYFGYCDDPASVAVYGNNNYYPLDYISLSQSAGSLFRRQKNLPSIGIAFGGEQNVNVKTSIDCATPTPDATTTDVIFLDDGATDYGTNYPLGKARPFLRYLSQNFNVNTLVRITNEASSADEFYLIVATVPGGGRLMMPIITENITMTT